MNEKLRTLITKGVVEPGIVEPREHLETGLKYGLTSTSYDIRLGDSSDFHIYPGETFISQSLENFNIPFSVMGWFINKSSLARIGLDVKTGLLQPGWKGFLTLEIVYTETGYNKKIDKLMYGMPIGQIVFMGLEEEAKSLEHILYHNRGEGDNSSAVKMDGFYDRF